MASRPDQRSKGRVLPAVLAPRSMRGRVALAIGVALGLRELWMRARAAARSFRGQVVVITGGGSGIGRLVALLFAREGAAIALWDLNLEGAHAVAAECRAVAPDLRVKAFKVDVSDKASVDDATSQTLQDFGRCDV